MADFRGTIFDVDGALVDSPHEQARRRDLKRSGSSTPAVSRSTHSPREEDSHGGSQVHLKNGSVDQKEMRQCR